MYFIIKKGTATFEKLSEVKKRMDVAVEASDELVKRLNGKRYYKKGYPYAAGGIVGIEFDIMPENWKKVNGDSGFYFPKSCKANKKLIAEINDLPLIEIDEFNECVGFETHFKGLTQYISPGINCSSSFHLMKTSDECDYYPPADVVEVLCSEYNKLIKEIESNNPESK